MPFLEIIGVPPNIGSVHLFKLEVNIKAAVAGVPTFGDPGAEAVVSCPEDRLMPDGSVLAVMISGVYVRQDRDENVMQQLREVIADCLEQFALLNLPECHSVEVFPAGYRTQREQCEVRVIARCPRCRGRGIDDGAPCSVCLGTGRQLDAKL